MTLDDLLWRVNDNTVVKLFGISNLMEIATYDGKDSIPEEYNNCDVTDIFVDGNALCVEIDDTETDDEW